MFEAKAQGRAPSPKTKAIPGMPASGRRPYGSLVEPMR